MHRKPNIFKRYFNPAKGFFTRRIIVIFTVMAALMVGGAGFATAAVTVTAGGGPATHASGCVVGPNRTYQGIYVNKEASCGSSTPLDLTSGAGQKGDKGDTGDTGPSGVQQISEVAAGATLDHIGGSWVSGHAVVKTIDLPAGTYHVIVTGDFYKTVTTTATPVLQIQLNGGNHQLTGYTGAFPANAAEAVGLGTDGTPNGLEQTAVADGVITLSAAGTVEVDAFGYNPDRSGSGGGDFGVNARVDVIQLTPAA